MTIKKIRPPRPPKPVDRIQNIKTVRPFGKTQWVKAHWRWDYNNRKWGVDFGALGEHKRFLVIQGNITPI